jgi:hypothetical protein
MDGYLWTLLFSGLANTAAALDARPAPAALTDPETARVERLVAAHRGLGQPLRVIPVGAPPAALPQSGCAPADR